ncbi:ParD-like family protein [Kiloniella antarctica]|uniref:ParD-like family protein n=1 Tax=Kiloniella antarctica TaxID=1550907 RepID=A0ABW5BS06_9PROT
MGIVKISGDMHEKTRIASKAMTRSINAQAEHWMKVGMMAESHPQLCYTDLLALMLDAAHQHEIANSQSAHTAQKTA